MIIPHETEEVVEALVKAFGRVRTVIDVGSGDGYEVSRIDADRRIAIDAHPGVPRLYTNVEYFTTAISDFDGVAPFYTGPSPGCSSLYDRGGEVLPTPVARLDTFCQDRGIVHVDALIIDTEGTTYDVLVGATELTPSLKFIYAEVQIERLYPNKLFHEVNAYLESCGFSRMDTLPSYTAGDQANYLWTRP